MIRLMKTTNDDEPTKNEIAFHYNITYIVAQSNHNVGLSYRRKPA